MAHSNNSVITGKLRGMIGQELVFREWEGKTVVAKAPGKREVEPTAKQLLAQETFLLASRYADAVTNGDDQGIKDAYNARLKPRQNLFARAVQDFLSPPVVKTVGTGNYTGIAGSKITVRAIDDFRVSGVQVEITAANGTLLEKGDAVQQLNGVDWTYTATQANNPLAGSKVKAIATDVPGNEGFLELTL